MSTFDKVVAMLKAHAIINPDQVVSLTSRFVEDLSLDSLDKVEMAMQVEEEFRLDLTDDQVAKIETVQQLVDAIEGRKVAG